MHTPAHMVLSILSQSSKDIFPPVLPFRDNLVCHSAAPLDKTMPDPPKPKTLTTEAGPQRATENKSAELIGMEGGGV